MSQLMNQAFQAGAPATPAVARTLEPELLLEQGILRNVAHPTGALQRAQSLIRAGAYRQAIDHLKPHYADVRGHLRVAYDEAFATCAAYGAQSSWRDYAKRALKAHRKTGHTLGQARITQLMGEMAINAGDVEAASRYLRYSLLHFREHDAHNEVWATEALLARRHTVDGNLRKGLQRLERLALSHGGAPRSIGEAKLFLAKAELLNMAGQTQEAARYIVKAERILHASGDRSDRAAGSMLRADGLLIKGQADRAVTTLRRVLVDTVDADSRLLRAQTKLLLGKALSARADCSNAQRHLKSAAHIFAQAGANYLCIEAHIALATTELRLNLNPKERLARLGERIETDWPILSYRYALTQQELSPESSEANLQQVQRLRKNAMKQGWNAVVRELDMGIAQDLGAQTVQEFSPVKTYTRTYYSIVEPKPMKDKTEDDAAVPAQTVAQNNSKTSNPPKLRRADSCSRSNSSSSPHH